MQTTLPTIPTSPIPTTPVEEAFSAIPTRIQDVPPLVVEHDEQTRQEIIGRLEAISLGLAQTHRASAEAYLSQTMYEEALPHLEAATTFASGVMEYHNQLGYVSYLIGNDEKAISAFLEVLHLEPGNADSLFNLAMVYFGQEKLAEAEDCFRRCLEARPNDSETWNNRGVCLFQMANKPDAKVCFERALQLDPQNEDATINLQSY